MLWLIPYYTGITSNLNGTDCLEHISGIHNDVYTILEDRYIVYYAEFQI